MAWNTEWNSDGWSVQSATQVDLTEEVAGSQQVAQSPKKKKHFFFTSLTWATQRFWTASGQLSISPFFRRRLSHQQSTHVHVRARARSPHPQGLDSSGNSGSETAWTLWSQESVKNLWGEKKKCPGVLQPDAAPASRRLSAKTSLRASRGDVLAAIMTYSGQSVRPWIRRLLTKYFRDVRLLNTLSFQPSHRITVSKRRCCGYLLIFGENKAVNQAYGHWKRVSAPWHFEGEEGKTHKLEITGDFLNDERSRKKKITIPA